MSPMHCISRLHCPNGKLHESLENAPFYSIPMKGQISMKILKPIKGRDNSTCSTSYKTCPYALLMSYTLFSQHVCSSVFL